MPTSDHQHKRRAALGGWLGPRIAFALTACAQQAVVKPLGVGTGLEFFGLQHKVTAPVAVDAPGAGGAVAVGKGRRALKHVVLLGLGVWFGHRQKFAQVDDETLRGGQLAGLDFLPALDKHFGCYFLCHGGRR